MPVRGEGKAVKTDIQQPQNGLVRALLFSLQKLPLPL